MGIALLAVSSHYPGSTMTTGGRLAACLVSTFALEAREAADMILEHCEVAHRHRRLVLYVVKKAIVSSCGQTRRASVQVGAGAASQWCECQQRYVVAESGCTEEIRCFQGCCLHFLRELEWRAVEAVEEVVADVQLAVWPMMENKSLRQ